VFRVKKDQLVVVGGTRLGEEHDEPLLLAVLQRHRLVAEVEVSDLGVVEGLGVRGVRFDVEAVPQVGEVRALRQEFADQLGQVRGVRFRAGQGAQPTDAGTGLLVPVVEYVTGEGVEEGVAGEVPSRRRPVRRRAGARRG